MHDAARSVRVWIDPIRAQSGIEDVEILHGLLHDSAVGRVSGKKRHEDRRELTADRGSFSYLILPMVFGRPDEKTRIDKTASAVFALFFIGVAYTASIAIAFFQRQRKIFVLRSLFVFVPPPRDTIHTGH